MVRNKFVTKKRPIDAFKFLDSTSIKVIVAIVMLSTIVLYAYMLNYIFKLETVGCECAKDWRRDYIQYYLLLLIVYVVVLLCVMTMGDMRTMVMINLRITVIMFILGVCFIVFTLQYVHRLKTIKCKCSEGTARDVLQIVATINAVILGITVLKMIAFAIMLSIVLMSKK